MSWHPDDPRGWTGPSVHDPRFGWGSRRPMHPNQLGAYLPSGGAPAMVPLSVWAGIALFILSPLVLVFWVAGQALLRVTGWRWWKLAIAAGVALALVVFAEGGPKAALALHFSGYVWMLKQFGKPVLHAPAPGALLWPQLPLSVPAGFLAAALTLAGRRQAIHPAEVRREQRAAKRRMEAAVSKAQAISDDHWDPPGLGVEIDGDLGWADKHSLVRVPPRLQARSRLIIGTSGMGKSVDVEREAFLAARAGRKFFLVDGKGTDPGFVERALAGYLWGHPYARVALWPELPMDGWRGTTAALHNRLMAMLAWTEPYYKDVASLLLRLALNAPGEDGPVRSSQRLMERMDPEVLCTLYEHQPERFREADSLRGRDQHRAVSGAIGRFANFFAAVGAGFDAAHEGWSFEDVDFAYLRAPYLAGKEDADAAVRLILEDFAHYATIRKPRRGEDATLVVDEFSAISGGREIAIQLVERVRDAGCAVYLSAQSAHGLGDEHQQARLLGACSGGLLLHAVPDPHALLTAAGIVKVVEQTWRLDRHGPTGNSSARIGEKHKIDPGAVQQAREGEAWYIARGRYEHLMVAQTRISDAWRARSHAVVALARSRRPEEPLPGARTWREAERTARGALASLEAHLAIEAPPAGATDDPDDPPPPEPAGDRTGPKPPAPNPTAYRLRQAVATGAREGDASTVQALIAEGQRRGLAPEELLAVAERFWPLGRLARMRRAGRRWLGAGPRRLRLHRGASPSRRPAVEQEDAP